MFGNKPSVKREDLLLPQKKNPMTIYRGSEKIKQDFSSEIGKQNLSSFTFCAGN